MRRLLVSGAATLAAVGSALFPAAPAAAHDGIHTVRISVSMRIVDDEVIGSEKDTATFSDTALVGPSDPDAKIEGWGCAGKEVRVEAFFLIKHLSGGSVRVSPGADLFEGKSCWNDDYDGWVRPDSVTVGANKTLSGSFKIKNREGGDKATISYTIVNQTS